MTIQELQAALTAKGWGGLDFMTGGRLIESAQLEEDINGDGGLSLSWRSATGGMIRAGETLLGYVMASNYVPQLGSDGIFQWSPKFSSPAYLLSKTLYYKRLTMTDETVTDLYTFVVAGSVLTIVSDINTFLGTMLPGWEIKLIDPSGTLSGKSIVVKFDGDNVKSAVNKIAEACYANICYVGKDIRLGIFDAFADGDYYNRFVVLGGTKNMAKRTPSGNNYAAVTQRLKLDEGTFTVDGDSVTVERGSIIDMRSAAEKSAGVAPMTRLLIFDDVYPELNLTIGSVHSRICYLLDNNGDKISDGQGGYKKYAKWYVTLELEGEPYVVNTHYIIQDKPLSLLFQSGALTGYEFEIATIASGTTEKDEDDVSAEGYTANSNQYRIILQSSGEVLLPSLPAAYGGGMFPKPGDVVTLVNVAIEDSFKTVAKSELLRRGYAAAKLVYSAKVPSYNEERTWPDFMIPDNSTPPELGDAAGASGSGYIVTGITTNLITGERSLSYGTFKPKSLLKTAVDKIEELSVSSSKGTSSTEDVTVKEDGSGAQVIYIYTNTPGQSGGDASSQHTSSAAQTNTIREAGGNVGLAKVAGKVNQNAALVAALGADVQEIKQQSDKEFLIWFGKGVPTASNYPAEDWNTEDLKALHAQDIYYNTERAAGSQGGRAYRWIEENGTYGWHDIADQDTLAALEKIADVAGDGVITAGMEKARLWNEWQTASQTYKDYVVDSQVNGISEALAAYQTAYWALWSMLNGSVAKGQNDTYSTVPLWLNSTNYSKDTKLSTYNVTAVGYRTTWDTYYEKLGDLRTATGNRVKTLASAAQQTADSKVACKISATVPAAPYNRGDLWWKLNTDGITGTMYTCITPRATGDATAGAADWTLLSAAKLSVTELLTELTNLLATQIQDKYDTLNCSIVNVYFASAMPSGAQIQDIRFGHFYVTETSGSTIYDLDSDGYTESNYEVSKVLEELRQAGITHFAFHKDADAQFDQYDVHFQTVQFHDNFTNTDITGSLAIWLGGRTSWQRVQDGTSGLLENFGDHIIAAVFGVSPDPTNPTNYASGLTTQQNFSQMFAQATNAATGATVLAAIKTIIETNQQGQPTGRVVVDADRVDFTANAVNVKGTLTSSDGTVVISTVSESGDGTRRDSNGVAIGYGEGTSREETVVLRQVSFQRGIGFSSKGELLLYGIQGIGGKEKALVSPEIIESSKYGISFWDYNQNDFDTMEGVGELSSPVTFDTADGKRVTVIGGIITDVSTIPSS